MPNTNLFANFSFNPNILPENAVVFDAGGIIRYSGVSNPDPIAYSPPWMDAYIESSFAGSAYADVVTDVSVQFPNATYAYGINSVVITPTTTTYYNDNGHLGTNGSDVVVDFVGNDIVKTKAGDDLVMVGMGDDRVHAGGGNDIVFTLGGDDIVKAGGGHDQVYLGDGNDHAQGNGGRDQLFGEAGDDCLDGGGGRDRLDGGEGNDTLTGGNGRDTFVFALGDGADVITDLEARDWIELDTALGVSAFGDIAGIASQSGADLVLTFAGGDSLTLEDRALSDLAANDFIFV